MTQTGADVVLEVLRTEGVTHVFGNPGTTELPLTDALAGSDDIRYVLALQEATAAGIADAYAQVTGRPAFLNLHTAVGLGNAAGNLANALANGSPLVVTAGQQDERHLASEPFLSGNLVEIARPVTKCAHEVRSPGELGAMLRRAFRDALAPPPAPVFLSIRMDHLQRAATPAPPRFPVDHGATAGSLELLAAHLCEAPAGAAALVLGDEVARSGALGAVTELAETVGAMAYGAPLFGAAVFPISHELWGGMLGLSTDEIRATLQQYHTVLAIGATPFQAVAYTPGPPVPEGTVVLQLSADPLALGRAHPLTLGVTGDVRASVQALTELVSGRIDASAVGGVRAAAVTRRAAEYAAWEERAQSPGDDMTAPLEAVAAARTLMRSLPRDTPLVLEAPTSGRFVRAFHAADRPGTFFFGRGGGLGWAMPAACGVALGGGSRVVLCAVGDGASMYSPQALWTAAHHELPVVFAIFDNGGYAVLRDTLDAWEGRSARIGRYVGLDLTDPPLDFVALASSMGVAATSVGSLGELRDVAAAATERPGPHLVHIPLRPAHAD